MKTVALMLTLAVGSAQTCATTGNELQRYLQSSERLQAGQIDGAYEAGVGLGYITGVGETIGGLVACYPTGVTKGQSIAVVKKYLDDHPEQLNQNAAFLSATALSAAFPCKQK